MIIATHTLDRANWLERDLVAQARARFEVPITHLVVEPERDQARRAVQADEPGPPAERHRVRDISLLVAAVMLAIVGTLVSFLLYDADVPTPLLAAWVLIMDLGVKLGLIGVAWALFLRRPRADRLDF